MRILVLTNLYPPHGVGGYEERCRLVVEGLRERGHTVTVLTSDYIRGEQVPWERGVARELWLNGLFDAPYRSYAALSAIEEQNHDTLQIWLRRAAPEVVYVWNLGGLSKSLLLALRRQGVPYLIDVGDAWLTRTWRTDPWLTYWNAPATRWHRLTRAWREAIGTRRRVETAVPTGPWTEPAAETLLFGTACLRNRAAAQGWDVGRSTVLPAGVPLEAIPVRPERPWSYRILWVGRVQTDRAPGVALTALAKLQRLGPAGAHWSLDFLGRTDRNHQDELEAQARQLGVLSAVSFRAASLERRRELYADYDVFWGTATVHSAVALADLWEARAAGLATVVPDIEGFQEALRPGVNGWSYPPGDAEALARQTLALAADPAGTAAVCASAREEARTRHGLGLYLDCVEEQLAAAHRGA